MMIGREDIAFLHCPDLLKLCRFLWSQAAHKALEMKDLTVNDRSVLEHDGPAVCYISSGRKESLELRRASNERFKTAPSKKRGRVSIFLHMTKMHKVYRSQQSTQHTQVEHGNGS